MNAKLLSLFALISFVVAQGPGADDTTSAAATGTATGGAATPSGATQLPKCIQDCVTQTAADEGCDPTQAACVCDTGFITKATTCVSACTPEEQAAALQLQQTMCAGGAGGASGSASGSASATGSATTLATAPGPVSTATRPVSSGASASASRPASSGSASGSAASPSSTNGAASIAAQGVWAVAAGVVGLAVAL